MKRSFVAQRAAGALLLFQLLIPIASATEPEKSGHGKNVGNGVTSLDVCADGSRVSLLIAKRDGEKPPVLQYLRSNDGGASWSDAATVGAGQAPPIPAHRGADAQIAAAGERVVAVWTTEGTEDRFGRGPMASAYSHDGGKTWTAGPNPADDGKATGHAFVDLAAGADGTFHLVWLDGRDGPAAGKGLRYARSTDGGATWSANATIDPQTCECCWNTIAAGPNGKVYILYRDRDPRDMAIVQSSDGGKTWQPPVTVGNFGWTINGCPHVGGGLAIVPTATEPTLHAIVWTAKDAQAHGSYVLSSANGGKTWSAPHQLGGPTSWRPDIAADENRVVAVWDAYVDNGTAVFASTSSDRGKSWNAPERLNSNASAADHPRIIRTPEGFSVFWTERLPGKETTWVVRKIP